MLAARRLAVLSLLNQESITPSSVETAAPNIPRKSQNADFYQLKTEECDFTASLSNREKFTGNLTFPSSTPGSVHKLNP